MPKDIKRGEKRGFLGGYMTKRTDLPSRSSATPGIFTRRHFLIATGAGATSLAMPHVVSSAFAQATAAPTVDAAKAEGPMVVWHGDQEADVVEFLKDFSQKTGVPAVQQRLLPGAALPKLEIEFRTGQTSGDVYITSDSGIMEQLRL